MKHFFLLSRYCWNCKKIEVYIKQSRYRYTYVSHILHMYLRLLNLCFSLSYDIQMNANVMTPNALVITMFCQI